MGPAARRSTAGMLSRLDKIRAALGVRIVTPNPSTPEIGGRDFYRRCGPQRGANAANNLAKGVSMPTAQCLSGSEITSLIRYIRPGGGGAIRTTLISGDFPAAR